MSDKLACKIRRTWYSVCSAYPDATTPFVSREVARQCRVSITEVFAAF